MAKISKEDVLSYLENANMLEISDLISDIEDEILEIESLIREASEMGFDELEEVFLKEMLDHAFRTGEIGFA